MLLGCLFCGDQADERVSNKTWEYFSWSGQFGGQSDRRALRDQSRTIGVEYLCGWLLLERGVHLSMCMWITYFGLLCGEKKPAKEIWRRNAQSWTVMDFLSLRFHLEVALWTFSWTFEFIWTSGQGVFEEVELTPYRSLYDGITDGRVKVDRWRHSEQNKDDKVHDINTKRIHKECTQHTQQSYILPK